MEKQTSKESPIACDLSALNAQQRERRHALEVELRRAVEEVQELENGYALRLDAEPALLNLAEFITLERLCCPFLHFAVELEREGGPLWLRVTGRGGVKEFLRAEFGLKTGGPPQVAGAVMSRVAFQSWLDAYGRAWETRDPEAVVALFTESGTYQETPFVEPMRGRAAIAAYWSRATGPHSNVHFGYEVLTLDGNQGIAHWWCSFVRLPGKASLKLDGIFVLQFDGEGRCNSLREWWHRQENQLP